MPSSLLRGRRHGTLAGLIKVVPFHSVRTNFFVILLNSVFVSEKFKAIVVEMLARFHFSLVFLVPRVRVKLFCFFLLNMTLLLAL